MGRWAVANEANHAEQEMKTSAATQADDESATAQDVNRGGLLGEAEQGFALVRDAAPRVVESCVAALNELARLYKCDLSEAVPVLRNIAKIGDERVRWYAQNALSFIPRQ